jgi:hypothetical protein
VAAFTEARNSLAAARRAAGDTDGASRVKALVKPSVVAWAVNQVFWSERVAFDRVVGAVREVLAAQRGALVGDADVDVRGAMRRKGEALQAAVRAAERKVEEAALRVRVQEGSSPSFRPPDSTWRSTWPH